MADSPEVGHVILLAILGILATILDNFGRVGGRRMPVPGGTEPSFPANHANLFGRSAQRLFAEPVVLPLPKCVGRFERAIGRRCQNRVVRVRGSIDAKSGRKPFGRWTLLVTLPYH